MSGCASLWRGLALGLLWFAAGCSTPSLHLTVKLPEGTARDAVTLSASIYSVGSASTLDCERLAWGDAAEAELQAALVLRQELDPAGGAVDGLPRLGLKLLLVEGSDSAGQRLMAACLPLDEIGPGAQAAVALEPAVHASLSLAPMRYFTATVHIGSVAPTVETVAVMAHMATGEVAPGAAVRLRLTGPTGARTEEVLTMGASGSLQHAPTLRFTGPFSMRVDGRFGRADNQSTLDGTAVPDDTVVTVAGLDLAQLAWIYPARLGARTGFLAYTKADELQTVLPVSPAASDGAVHFALGTYAALPAHGTLSPLGAITLGGVAGADANGAVVLRNGASMGAGLLVVTDVDVVLQQVGIPNTFPERAAVVGPCVGERDTTMLFLVLNPAAGNNFRIFGFLDLHGTVVQDPSYRFPMPGPISVVEGACVQDGGGAWHRLLIQNRSVDPSSLVADLGAGVTPTAIPIIDPMHLPMEPVPAQGLGVFGHGEGMRIIDATFAGLSYEVHLSRVAPQKPLSPDAGMFAQVLENTATLPISLPTPPLGLVGGSLYDDGRVDVAALLRMRAMDPVVLLVAAANDMGGFLGGRFVFDGMPQGVDGAVMALGDVNADGRQEILVAVPLPPIAGQPVPEPRVVRLGTW